MKKDKMNITLFCEFKDKLLEKEFYYYDMNSYVKFLGPVALVFGIIYMIFLVGDYFSTANVHTFRNILFIRTLFFIISVLFYFIVKKMKGNSYLYYLITSYEIVAILGFFIIMDQYGTFTLLTLFSVMAITLAIYIIPNKLTHTLVISGLFNLSFMILFAKNIEGINYTMVLQILAYNLIITIYCSIGAYIMNYYKRKQFIDSRELLRISITDPLTGIYNRIKINEELKRCIEYSQRYNSSLSLVMFDIDDFKKVNDEFGHLTGDSVLTKLTGTIKKEIRSSDIFARWGGEEFIILLPNTDITHAKDMMERIRICIENSYIMNNKNITCSFGIASLGENESPEALLHRADKLLYLAKERGKNTIIYDENLLKLT